MKFKAIILAFICLFLCAFSVAEDDDSWVVMEEDYLPDLKYQAQVLMRKMTLEEKICQMMFVCPEDLTGETYTVAWPANGVLRSYPVGGILLFGQNVVSETQLKKLTDDILSDAAHSSCYAPFIAVEEEGGSVSRIANKLGYPLADSPASLGKQNSKEKAYLAGKNIGEYLNRFHISLNFAPVADVLVEPDNELKVRCFGSDAQTVAEFAVSMADGLQDSGVLACFKHFPGQGAAVGKVYKGTSRSRRSLDQMRACELIPFARGIANGIPMIMVSHMTARGIDDSAPASFSYAVTTGLLRDEMRFDGVIITDSLRGGAITSVYRTAKAVRQCVLAGTDMLLLPSDLNEAVFGLVDAVKSGEISEKRIDESVEKILAMKIEAGLIQ